MKMLDDNSLKRINELAEIIDSLKKNTISLGELGKFKLLFLLPDPDNPPNPEEVVRLSNDFVAKFDMYRPIEVLDSRGAVIFKIPQMFIPIVDIRKEYSSLVNEFRNNSTSDIPKYQAEAHSYWLAAIMKSQQANALDQGFTSFSEMVAVKGAEYRKDVDGFNKTAVEKAVEVPVEGSPSVEDDGFKWE